jgi:hypothetical protein
LFDENRPGGNIANSGQFFSRSGIFSFEHATIPLGLCCINYRYYFNKTFQTGYHEK